jgi:hypothetical protein
MRYAFVLSIPENNFEGGTTLTAAIAAIATRVRRFDSPPLKVQILRLQVQFDSVAPDTNDVTHAHAIAPAAAAFAALLHPRGSWQVRFFVLSRAPRDLDTVHLHLLVPFARYEGPTLLPVLRRPLLASPTTSDPS